MSHYTGAVPGGGDPHAKSARGLDLAGLVTERFADRYWSKVDPTGDCWEWMAYRKPNGYGSFAVRKGVFYQAHNVSYALVHGPIPPRMVVCHRCDNPPCCNPDHLFLGTQCDNVRDMFAKGRAVHSRGEQRYNARLTEQDVREIRAFGARYGLHAELARAYGVSTTTIRKIRNGTKWGHVA